MFVNLTQHDKRSQVRKSRLSKCSLLSYLFASFPLCSVDSDHVGEAERSIMIHEKIPGELDRADNSQTGWLLAARESRVSEGVELCLHCSGLCLSGLVAHGYVWNPTQ